MSLVSDAYTLAGFIILSCGVVAAFFRDKLTRQKAATDDKTELLKIIHDSKLDHSNQINQLELRINNILAQDRVKVDLFWRMVEDRMPLLLLKETPPAEALLGGKSR